MPDEGAIRAKLDTLPTGPGVYVFRGVERVVLYVGKARSLRSRVRSYFQPGSTDQRFFISLLDRELEDIETFVTATEKEAALLENQLIKENQPRYNIKLRDDKEFLSLRLDPTADWPRLEVVRKPRKDSAQYFGPYHSATAARQTLRMVNRHFQLRTCTDAELRSRVRPCLQFQIKRCPAPCVHPVDRGEYQTHVKDVALFLEGRHEELVDHLRVQMSEASQALEFERAAAYRDRLRAVERVQEQQRVASARDIDQDAIGLFRQADAAELAVLAIRGGRLQSVRTYGLRDVVLPDDELIASFLGQLYPEGAFVPSEVLLPMEIEVATGLAEMLSEGRGAKVSISAPKRAPKVDVVKLANENAAHAFAEKARAREDIEARLTQVMERLRLPTLPRRIECIDVSHTGGQDAVAAVVALTDGAPDRSRYRSFNVKRAAGGDDYGAMYEVLSRRLRRGRDGVRGFELPDLLVVDGGKGQLAVALTAMRDLGVSVPVVALAKEKDTAKGERVVDRVYLPGQKNALALRDSSPALQLLALARDEAHRSSNELRKRRGHARSFRSELDSIPGIGPRTKQRLLRTFGSVEALHGATEEQLRAAGANRAQAHRLAEAFRAAPADFASVPPAEEGETIAEELAVDNAFAEALRSEEGPAAEESQS